MLKLKHSQLEISSEFNVTVLSRIAVHFGATQRTQGENCTLEKLTT